MKILLVIFASLLSLPTSGQWEIVTGFPSRINAIHFLDDAGFPDIGFIGLTNAEVYKTTDGGVSWTRTATLPILQAGYKIYSTITDFAFETDKHGWCSGDMGFFETVDGGKTWSIKIIWEFVASVEYNKVSNILLFTPVSKGLCYSTDQGATYSIAGYGSIMRGITFLSPQIGLATSYDYTALRTTDGGQSWYSANLFTEAWQPCAVRGSNSLFAISEPFIGTNKVYRSTSGGLSWDTLYTFPYVDQPTGMIAGLDNTLLVQTRTSGFFKSTEGIIWENICGPSNEFDSRFCVTSNGLFGGDYYGNLWRNRNLEAGFIGKNKLQFSIDSLFLSATACEGVSGIIYFGNVLNCVADSIQLIKVEVFSSNNQIDIDNVGILPREIGAIDSIKLSSKTIITLDDTAFILLTFKDKYTTYDTVIVVGVDRVPTPADSFSYRIDIEKANVNLGRINVCIPFDFNIIVSNKQCEDLIVEYADFEGGHQGFEIIDSLSPKLNGYFSDSIRIQCAPQSVGNYLAKLKITTRYLDKTFDTLIAMKYTASTGISLSSIDTLLDFGIVSVCKEARKLITLKNTSCDTILLTEINLNSSTSFTLESKNLPIVLAPGGEFIVPVLFSPQIAIKYLGNLDLRATLPGTGSQMSLIIDLTGTGIGEKGNLDYYPQSIAFSTLSICNSDSGRVYLFNVGCDTLQVLSMNVIGSDFSVGGAAPLQLAPGDTMTCTIYIAPTRKGFYTGNLIIVSLSDGISMTDTLAIIATASDGARILSSTLDSINFGMTSLCEELDSAMILTNNGCDTLIISDITINGQGFRGSGVPIIILPGDSAAIEIETIIDTTGGATTNNATVSFTSNADNVVAPIVLMRSFELPPSYGMGLQMLQSDGTADEFVTLQLVAGNWWLGTGGVMRGINRLDFDLAMNTDLLHYISSSGANGVSLNGNHVTIAGNPEVVAPNGVIAEFVYRVHLTKDSVTDILLTNLLINNDDPSPCKPTIQSSGAGFSYRYVCGDGAIQRFLRTGKALEITSIRPNPARDEVVVEFIAAQGKDADGTSALQIFDAAGKLVGEYPATGTSVTIPLSAYSAGSYVVRLRAGEEAVAASFVVER